jgi:hypothetical protein
MDIHTALILIDDWVATLHDEDLPEKCREAGNDFFAFLNRRGFSPRIFAKSIFEITGMSPRNLWTVEDAETLRHYLRAYNGEQVELSKEELRYGKSNVQWLKDATVRFFSR